MRGHLSGGHGSGCRDHGLVPLTSPSPYELILALFLTLMLDGH
jgi:hypothetical protein